MKDKLLKSFSLALALSLFAFTSTNTSAEEVTSTTSVEFSENKDITTPLDPLDPSIPGGEGGTGMGGPLSLDFVPTMNFGTHTLSSGISTFNALNLKPYIQVSDTRGTGTGWSVKASLSDFMDTATKTKKLDGAILSFYNSNVFASTPTNSSNTPTGFNFDLSAGGSTQTILHAQAGEGMGTWLQTWLADSQSDASNSNATLTLDTSSAFAQAYDGTITWSIELAP